uniref:Ganglioside GM2 activator-like n=1 Tax=Danio rerio TaxID=7955 RepID=A0A286YA46_DANRE|nr:ganglioside GM2 activator-like [Danio rerio]|eukprot:XP_003199939.1 ganglioside GM2 activator-like [Danio rerio]
MAVHKPCKMSCVSLLISLFAFSCVLKEVSSQWLSRKTFTFTKFNRFSWEKCGNPDAPFHWKTLHVYPNAIPSPGIVLGTASASIAVDLTSPLPVNLTLEKEVAGAWVKIPCVNGVGSCYYPDACDQLAEVMSMFSLCPEHLRLNRSSCRCPFKAGDYNWPTSDSGIYIPNFSLSDTITNFRLHVILGSTEKELGCFKVKFSLATSLKFQHHEL